MDREKALEELLLIPGIAGHEREIANKVFNSVISYVDDIKVDRMGNVVAKKKGREEGKGVLVATNLDQIGFIVTYIMDDGYLKIAQVGQGFIEAKAFDLRSYVAERVLVMGGNGEYFPGVIGFPRIFHHSTTEDLSKTWDIKELFIDIGVRSREDVENKGIQIGSPVISKPQLLKLAGGCYCSPALHSRAGCLVVQEAAKRIAKETPPRDVYWVWTAQQTIGSKGMKVIASQLEVDLGIVVVPTKASERIFLGKGPTLRYAEGWGGLRRGLIGDRRIVNFLKSKGLPIQSEISEGLVGQGKELTSSGYGIPGASIGIPLENLFTGSEIVDTHDINIAVDLLAEAVLSFTGIDETQIKSRGL